MSTVNDRYIPGIPPRRRPPLPTSGSAVRSPGREVRGGDLMTQMEFERLTRVYRSELSWAEIRMYGARRRLADHLERIEEQAADRALKVPAMYGGMTE